MMESEKKSVKGKDKSFPVFAMYLGREGRHLYSIQKRAGEASLCMTPYEDPERYVYLSR